jgi:C_GCAxxG_C_C family probable redox protein
MGKAENAREMFKSGFNCSQAVLTSFAGDFGLDEANAKRVAAAFGGGMGHMGKTCGAVTGAIMVLGLRYGMTVNDGTQSNNTSYDKVQEFANKFRAKHGSITCLKLLGAGYESRKELLEAIDKGIPQKICPGLVYDAAAIVEALI